MGEDWETRELADKGEILSYLERDRLYGAYAIEDLEPELFAQSRWVGAEKARQLRALILHFRGLKLPALFLMGDAEGLQAILEDALRPEQVSVDPDFMVWARQVQQSGEHSHSVAPMHA